MPRRCLAGTAGLVFHVINRGVRRLQLFDTPDDYAAWFLCFAEAQRRYPVDVFAYCLMPNHFHMVVRPSEDGQLPGFMRVGTVTHSMRWHAFRGTLGSGAVYQGRYRAFPVQTDGHFLRVCRYVEANALRARLVTRAEHWQWSSVASRGRNWHPLKLAEWPMVLPAG